MNTLNKLTTTLLSLTLLFGISSCGTNNEVPTLSNCSIQENTTFKSATILIPIESFNDIGFTLGDSVNISFSNGFSLNDVPYFNGYYVKNGEPVLVAYPSDTFLTVTYNNLGIWEQANLTDDDSVDIILNEKGKFIATQSALGQSYSLERSDYGSDEEFSNFRALKGGSLKDNLIYRGASPVDNSRSRAKITS